VRKGISDVLASVYERDHLTVDTGGPEHMIGHNLKAYLKDLEAKMRDAAANLEFEEAAQLRDEIRRLEAQDLELPADASFAEKVKRAEAASKSRRGAGKSGRPGGGRRRRGP
jgi:excinuclease ABC subunit B